MSRWKAASIHFLISLAVLATVAGVVVWRWYPPALFTMAKAGPLLGTIGVVDLVLGPLLTLIIYRAGKRGLKFDLAVIGLVQVAALAYGLWTLWQSRPVYVVALEDRFRMVFANEVDTPSLAQAPDAYRRLPALGPHLVAAPLPDDAQARLRAMLDEMGGLSIAVRPDRYRAYPHPKVQALIARGVPAGRVAALAPDEARPRWQALAEQYPGTVMLPMASSRGSAAVFIDAASGALRGYGDGDPWPVIDAATARAPR